MSALATAHRAVGGLSLAAGALTVLGGMGPLLRIRSASALGEVFGDAPAPPPDVPSAHWAVVAGALLAAVGAGLLLLGKGRAARIRPAASVLWAAPIPPALSALRTVSAAVDSSADPDPLMRLAAPELAPDWGAWLLVGALFLAVAAGLASVIAGVFDREEWEAARGLAEARERAGRRNKARTPAPEADPRDLPPDRRVEALLAAAGFFAAAGLLLPLRVGPGFRSPWLPDVPFSSEASGQFLLAAVLVAAAAVGARSRPSRRLALCAGAALAIVAYVAGYPVLAGGEPGSTPGPGLWASLVAITVFAAAAGVPRRGPDSGR